MGGGVGCKKGKTLLLIQNLTEAVHGRQAVSTKGLKKAEKEPQKRPKMFSRHE